MLISYYLLFFYLCISWHACNARCLDAAADKKLVKTFHISNRNDGKGIEKIPVVPKTMSSLSNELGETRGDSINESSSADYKSDNQKLNKTKGNQKIISNDESDKTSGAVQTRESLVSVSWECLAINEVKNILVSTRITHHQRHILLLTTEQEKYFIFALSIISIFFLASLQEYLRMYLF